MAMKNSLLALAALLAVSIMVVGCQNGSEAPAEGTQPNLSGTEAPPKPNAGDDTTSKNSSSENGAVAKSGAVDASGIMYAATFDKAVADAEKENKLVMIKFTADWCTPCHMMSDDMKKTDLSKEMANIIPIEVDVDKDPDGAAVKNHMSKEGAIPYLVIIDKTGKEIASHTGKMEMPEFKAWLEKAASASKA